MTFRALVHAALLVAACGSIVVAQEVPEGTWSGTRLRIRGQGNNPQQQRVTLEVKRAADPHGAWRMESRPVLNATFIVPQGRRQVSNLRLDNTKLTFSYAEEAEVRCELDRQADGLFVGECVSEADGRRFRTTLNSPKADKQ